MGRATYRAAVIALGLLGWAVVESPALTPMLPRLDHLGSQRAEELLRKQALWFEANQGQNDSRVKFISRGAGHTVFLAPAEVVLAVSPKAAVRMKLVAANPNPVMEGLGQLSGRSHYFLGNDPGKWRTDVPRYARVRYRDIYPGVDLVFYGNQEGLEFDFLVAAGADPGVVRLGFEGVEQMRLTPSGDLVLAAPEAEVRFNKPVVYQEVAGARRGVGGRYVVSAGRQVTFQVEAYDPSRPLVIDPALSYSTFLGGDEFEQTYGVAVDAAGNAYVTGVTESANFPTAGPLQGAYAGGTGFLQNGDVFVAKVNAQGNGLAFSTYIGGASQDGGLGVALDAAGNVYVTGATRSANFPTVRPYQAALRGRRDAFVLKLNPAGNTLLYSTYLGGGDGAMFGDIAYAIAVDSNGNAYVTGLTQSTNFPTTAGAIQTTPNTSLGNGFVTKLNAEGSSLAYSTYLRGSFFTVGSAIAVDASASAYVAGATQSGLPTTAGALQTTYGGGNTDAFVAKLNATGTALVYSTYLGGTDPGRQGSITTAGNFEYFLTTGDHARSMAVDLSGNAYVTGLTPSRNFPTLRPVQAAYGGGDSDAFLAKLNPSGTALIYSTYLGGSGSDEASGIAVDASGNAHLTGVTGSSDFPTASPIQPASANSFFVTKASADGSTLVYSTHLTGGGRFTSVTPAIAVDPSGADYVTGGTDSTDFRTTAEAFQTTRRGNYDAFLVKIADAPAPPVLTSVSAASFSGPALAVDSIASAFGQGLAPGTAGATTLPLPTVLAETSLRIKDSEGTELSAPLFFVSPGQINYHIPAAIKSGRATVTVAGRDQTVAAGTIQIEAVAPGIFTANTDGRGVPAALALRVGGDGAQTPVPVFQCGTAPGSCVPVALDLGAESDQVFLVLFGTGIRGRSSLSAVRVTMGGEAAEVQAAGPQGEFVGLDQVNIRVPRSLRGRGEVSVVLTVDGKSANTVTVRIG